MMSRAQRCTIGTLAAGFVLTIGLAGAQSAQPDSAAAVLAGMQHPSDDARPMVRWWWFGPAVQKSEILNELQQMKADGIGGAELAFVYPEVLDDPAKGIENLRFLSPAMLDAVQYAQAEGRSLGLRIDVTLCSGWPYGGPNTPLQQAAGRLRMVAARVPDGAQSIALPLQPGDTFIAAFVLNAAQHSVETPLEVHADEPSLQLQSESKDRVVQFFIAGHTRQQVKRAAVGAEGYVLDPFSHEAVATHLQKVGGPLVKAFGATPPYAIFSDSLEAYGADWTPALLQEFKRRRGYDLLPHLPELWAGGTSAAAKVRHDYGRTLTELVNENYLTQINDWARAHGTKFRSQTYGEPAVSLASERLVALPEGEGPQWRQFSTLRWATSANHLFGNTVSSGESFTWLHAPVFRATPLDMKAEADIDFLSGENQFVFHGWPYSPPLGALTEPESPWPGWSLYAAAVFNDHNPWHPVMPAVTAYLTRVSWLLRQGKPANQVAVLLPTDDAWAGFTPGHVSVTAAMQTLITPTLMSSILSAGYNIDFIDADTIDRQGVGAYQALVIPPTDRIPVATLQKIQVWRERGGHLLCVGRSPSLDAEGSPLPSPEAGILKSTFVPEESQTGAALQKSITPDFQFTLGDLSVEDRTNLHEDGKDAVGFIHRSLVDGDIYFVANTGNTPVSGHATFQTRFEDGQQIGPESGEVVGPPVHSHDVTITLAPYESRVILFSRLLQPRVVKPATEALVADLTHDWSVTFVGSGQTRTMSSLTDWMADPSTLHYSGEAVYTHNVRLDQAPSAAVYLQVDGGEAIAGSAAVPVQEHAAHTSDGMPNPTVTRPGPGMRAMFDPPVRAAALVFVNGHAAGALWHPPYCLDVTKYLHAGDNRIEVHVYNTLMNAWSAEPPHDYAPLIAKYGDRFQMQDLQKVAPVSSGLLGTVKLVSSSPQE